MRRVFLQTAVLFLCLVLCSCGQSERRNEGTLSIEGGSKKQQEKSDLPEAIVNGMTGDEGDYDIQTEEKEFSIYLEEDQFILGV